MKSMLRSIFLPLAVVLTAGHAMAQDPGTQFDKRQYLGDTLDLKLREGLKDHNLFGEGDPDLAPERMNPGKPNKSLYDMPYKKLRPGEPMPLMAIDDSVHYTLRIKKYRNYYKPKDAEIELQRYKPAKSEDPEKK